MLKLLKHALSLTTSVTFSLHILFVVLQKQNPNPLLRTAIVKIFLQGDISAKTIWQAVGVGVCGCVCYLLKIL